MDFIGPTELPRLTDEYKNRYRDTGVWTNDTILDRFAQTSETYPDSKIVGPRRTMTYEELAAGVEAVSAGLQKLGVGHSDVVSYQLPNWTTTSVTHLAVTRAGGVANAVIPIYRRREVEYIVGDAESKVLIIPETFRGFDYPAMAAEFVSDCPALEHIVVVDSEGPIDDIGPGVETWRYEELCETDPSSFTSPTISADDVHALLYTSGTTADPKGVLHTHNTLMYEERTAIELFGLTRESTVFMPSPVTHVTGMLYALEMPLRRGMNLVLQDIWDPESAIDLIEEHQCNTGVFATPFLRGIYEEAPDDWACPLRALGCGGADVPPELVRAASDKLDCTITRVYGSTEHPTMTWTPLDASRDKRAETDGPAGPGSEVKIRDVDTGEDLPPTEQGEILGHGPELMVGYLDAELNEDAFDGLWFKTGDLAVIDEEGYIRVTGRMKDIIVRGGENISVKEVEDILYEHAAVEEIAVVAMPDPELQEKGCAYVTLNDDHSFTFEEMTTYLNEQGIAKQKYPERLEIIDKFPTTASGKIQKTELRNDVAEKLGRDPVSRE